MNGQKSFWVYILASKRNGTIYTGHTDNLPERIWRHRTHAIPGFTSKYNCAHLVWREAHETRESAFLRERPIKKWNRAWKLKLIEEHNPNWDDLYDTLNT